MGLALSQLGYPYTVSYPNVVLHHHYAMLFIPSVVCNTPCEFGACVANDTCFCAQGYEGRSCTEPGM